MRSFTRRQFGLKAAGAAIAIADARQNILAQPSSPSKTRLILLGTGGGPRPRKSRQPSAQVILIKGAAYVIDCGDGVSAGLVEAGVALPSLRHIFITHHHSDHNADYGNLLLIAWASGLRNRVDSWAPRPSPG